MPRPPALRAMALALAALPCAAPGSAGEIASATGPEPPRPGRYALGEATSPIQVDGVLDETAWEDATAIPASGGVGGTRRSACSRCRSVRSWEERAA